MASGAVDLTAIDAPTGSPFIYASKARFGKVERAGATRSTSSLSRSSSSLELSAPPLVHITMMYESKNKDAPQDKAAEDGFCAMVNKLPPVRHVPSSSHRRLAQPSWG